MLHQESAQMARVRKSSRTAFILMAVSGTLVAGCRDTRSSANRPATGLTNSTAAHSQPAPRTTAKTSLPPDSLGALIQRLRVLPGSFEARAVSEVVRFRGETTLLVAIADFGHEAVKRLVDCLDDAEPARATFRGDAVPVGAMCYEALRMTAYHEATDERGDVVTGWPGYIRSPTLDQLRAAKAAWQDVLRRRAYTLS
jgi:hypothetical protein